MEEKETKNGGRNFIIGLFIGIILYKVIVEIIVPMFY